MKARWFSRWIAVACVVGSAFAAKPSPSPALRKKEITEADRAGWLAVPTPGELFMALDKVERPNWASQVRIEAPQGGLSRSQMALLLGVLVTEGFLAVQSQDGQQVKNAGREVIQLARSLGISEGIMSRGQSVGDFAANNDWNSVREELEATQNEVKLAMVDKKDGDLVALVMAGAWVRSLEAASSLIVKTYSEDASRLLHQPGVAAGLIEHLERLPERLRNDPAITSLRAGLNEVVKIVSGPAVEPLSKEQVARVRDVAEQMVQSISAAKP